jgi:hypothetical protein
MGNIAQTTTGAGYKLYINNRVVGITTSFEFVADSTHKPIYGIDSILPNELLPMTVSVSGSIGCVRLSSHGGLEARGIAASNSELLLEKYISIKLIDRATDNIVFACNEAVINSQNWKVEARNIMRGTFSFTGITWHNDYER